MKRKLSLRWLFVVLPYFLSVIGYVQAGYAQMLDEPALKEYYVWSSAMFNSFKIYAMVVAVGAEDMNIWLEMAKWMGAFVTTSVVVVVFKRVLHEISLRWKLRKPDAIIVHGDGVRRETVLHALGGSAIAAKGDVCFRANQHVLAFDHDSAAIRYLMENEKQLLTDAGKAVFFSSSEYEASDYAQDGFIVSNTAVNCARLYWQKHWLRDDAIRRIAIIGFDQYGQRLLEQALLVNVLPWRPSIEYHIYGSDGREFLAWRPQLEKCLSIGQASQEQDSLHFHPAPEAGALACLQRMDRIILAMDDADENILRLNQLLAAGVTGTIHVRCSAILLKHMQYLPKRQREEGLLDVSSFGEDEELYSREVILHGELCRAAKNTHINYVRQSKAENIRRKYASCQNCPRNGECGDCPRAAETWDDLTPFEKSSNIASADHDPVKRWLLAKAEEKGGLDAAHEALCRTEHIRWCRFYFLHNWAYAEKRDDNRRLHASLLPFDQLSKSEQEKDWWAYEDLLKEAK